MVDTNENKALKGSVEKKEAQVVSLSTMEEEEYEVEYEEEDEYEEEYEEDEEEEEEDEENDEQPEDEKVSNGGNETVVNKEQSETQTQIAVKEVDKKQNAVNKGEKKQNAVKGDEKKQNAVKDKKKVEEPKCSEKPAENLKTNKQISSLKKLSQTPSKEKRLKSKTKEKSEQKDSGTLTVNRDKPESSGRKKGSKRVECMGMVFMCSSKTKDICFRKKILGLPESKKDQVLKIYRGMRLFLFDVDLRLMYGIFKAAGPGGFNIEPDAFNSELPSQVRYTVMDNCPPLAEEKFKDALKENYYSRTKFESLLKGDQVKNLCRLLEKGKGWSRSRSAVKLRRTRLAEPRRTRCKESRRGRSVDRRTSLDREKRKRSARNEERRSRSPQSREKRRYTDYDHRRSPVVSRYLSPQPSASRSEVRLYASERPPLDVPSPYVHDRVFEPVTYRVVDRDGDPYLAVREPPLYRDAVYLAPMEYDLASREYPHPSALQAPEYHVRGSRLLDYRDVETTEDYRSSAVALPEYRSRTYYNY